MIRFNCKKCFIIILLILVSVLNNCSSEDSNWKTSIAPDYIEKKIIRKPVLIGATDYSSILNCIYANGGLKTNNKALFNISKMRISFEKIANIQNLIKLFNNRKLDIIALPLNSIYTQKLMNNTNSKIIFLTGWSNGNYTLLTNKIYSELKDFRNSKIACIKGSAEHSMAKFTLNANNISTDSIEWVYTQEITETIKLLSKMKIDAIAINQHQLPVKLSDIVKVLFSTKDCPKLVPYILFTHNNFLYSRKNDIKYLLKYFLKASHKLSKLSKKEKENFIHNLKINHGLKTEVDFFNSFTPAFYNDNRDFFNLNSAYKADFFKLYNLSYSANKNKLNNYITKSIDTSQIINLFSHFRKNSKNYAFKNIKLDSFSKLEKHVFIKIPFNKNESKININNDNLIKRTAFWADIFANSHLFISPLSSKKQNNKTLLYERIENIKAQLIKNYKINSKKIHIKYNVDLEDNIIETIDEDTYDYFVINFYRNKRS